ncbi:MAG TPA: acyl-CoA dehydrogenase family protein [Anaerolineae bacterium]|nr:acyl-CoA dehydrogenase family protein [Anaerolineae bacterium]
MDFTFSEEQQMFRAMFRDFSAKEVAPKVEEMDHEEKPPLDVLRKAANQGFLGATLPEDYFGAELDTVSYALLVETLARDCMSTAVTLATHVSLVAMSVLEHGTDAQKEEWLPLMAAGEMIGAFALTEPDAGSDAAHQSGTHRNAAHQNGGTIQTQAVPDGDDAILDGVKTWVANGGIAGLFLVFAHGAEGLEAFLVPKDTPGLTVGYREPTLGLRSVTFNTIYLEGCRVPQANRLGAPGEGWTVAQRAQDRMAVALAAAGLGVSEDAVDVAAQFATERVQFGVPVAKKQAIQSYVAGAFTEVEALRYLVYHAAWLVDQGGDFSFDASVVKAFGAQVARSVTNRMVQVMGGYGYMEDYPMARKYRDARALGIIGGPTELHHVRVAQRIFAERDVEIVP